MRIAGQDYRSIWIDDATGDLRIIDQTELPHRFEIRTLADVSSAAEAIRTMRVRGAPLIGATAAHGMALALARDASDESLSCVREELIATRPTAINLRWAIDRVTEVVSGIPVGERAEAARNEAIEICDEDVACCEAIGNHGLAILEGLAESKAGGPIQILTHCNAGWLATVDWGTALAPIYKAHAAGLGLHIWVDETRPRNQGSRLTAFELREQGIPHTVIVDNAGGHLMQRGLVDAVFVGSDRTTASGDVCNKIGTYLKALSADANDVPFYVALPLSSIDWSIENGLEDIPIEERSPSEVRELTGLDDAGQVARVSLFPEASGAANPAFDVTPARYVTGLLTEYGLCGADRESLTKLRFKQTHQHSIRNPSQRRLHPRPEDSNV
ncbi:MAG: S-methyl-5-thioribose-1-phosphate isomerase [Myxococcales bacterium]|nr:S-methyl-5-thioribose-1-phosphate isomerase [Myxococcales bacterium]HIK83725.1 S-methyl-5-thioribose-1-phosphate isomerase [Myxococcales bacterium]